MRIIKKVGLTPIFPFDFEEDASDNPTFYAELDNPQSLNKYQYTYNNPYKYNDPTGHCPGLLKILCQIQRSPAGRKIETWVFRQLDKLITKIPPPAVSPPPVQQVVQQVVKETPKIANVIKGYTKHGLNQAISRNGGKGVKTREILNAVRNPKRVTQQANGAVKYKGSGATVVTNSKGKVVTTYGKPRGPQIRPEGTKRPSGSGPSQRKANERGFSYNPHLIH